MLVWDLNWISKTFRVYYPFHYASVFLIELCSASYFALDYLFQNSQYIVLPTTIVDAGLGIGKMKCPQFCGRMK